MSPVSPTGSLLETLRRSRVKSWLDRIGWLHKASRRTFYTAIQLNPFVSPRYVYLGGGRYLDLRDRRTVRLGPNFIIIGAQRCATTSLHRYLDFHPKIFMSKPYKEPVLFIEDVAGKTEWQQYFDWRGRPGRNRDELIKCAVVQGYMGQPHLGEASTWYTMGYYSRDYAIPDKVRAFDPDMRLIYLVRHPLERIVSLYLCGQRHQHYGSLDRFIAEDSHALLNSRYWFQLEEYLRVFPAEQLKVIVFDDLLDQPQSVLDDTCAFLGTRPFEQQPPFEVHNAADNQGAVARPALRFSKQTHTRLVETLRPELEALSKFIARDLSHWDLSADRWCRPD